MYMFCFLGYFGQLGSQARKPIVGVLVYIDGKRNYSVKILLILFCFRPETFSVWHRFNTEGSYTPQVTWISFYDQLNWIYAYGIWYVILF